MTLHQKHLVEKLQVVVAAAATMAAGYFLFWPLVRPADVEAPLSFLPQGALGSLVVFALMVWAIALVCSLVTISARMEGTLLAALIGSAGMGLRGGQMQALLWPVTAARYPVVFGALAVEMLILTGVLVLAVVLVELARPLTAKLAPRWAWSNPIPADHVEKGLLSQVSSVPAPPGSKPRPEFASGEFWGALVLEIVVAGLVLVVTSRSLERGQIVFSLVASFLAGSLIAHQAFPIRSAVPFWLGPMIVGLGVFLLAAYAPSHGGTPHWHDALTVAQGLYVRAAAPVDWMTLGGAGAVGGLWMSRRVCELRHLDQQAAAASA